METSPQQGLRLGPGVIIPEAALAFAFSSSGGPGGQNVNKRATKCQLRIRLEDLPLSHGAMSRLVRLAGTSITESGELLITSDERKSQGQNKAACIERLEELVKRALVAPKIRRPTKPSRGAKERRLKEKKTRGELKRRRSELD